MNTNITVDPSLLSAKILIVDDDENILRLCEMVLKQAGFTNIKKMADPCGVLSHFIEYDPDLLILDIMMPRLDGLQLLDLLQSSAEDGLSLPILVVTAMDTPDNRHIALARGAVDVIGKPFHIEDFTLRVRNLLKIRHAFRVMEKQKDVVYKELVSRTKELSNSQLELKETQLEVIARLAKAGEQHDDDTGKHTQRVAVTSALIAQGIGLGPDEIEVIQRAAPLHDVGKIGVPDSILLKPGKLTEDEHHCMRRHCEVGADLLSGGRSEILQIAQSIAVSHHEKWNGQGYPHGLSGQDIPIEGRISAVADVFDALTHERPYKKAWSIADAKAEISRQAGTHFDPLVVNSFLDLPHDQLV